MYYGNIQTVIGGTTITQRHRSHTQIRYSQTSKTETHFPKCGDRIKKVELYFRVHETVLTNFMDGQFALPDKDEEGYAGARGHSAYIVCTILAAVQPAPMILLPAVHPAPMHDHPR